MIGAKNFIGSLIDQWLQKWSNCKILSWDSIKPQKETFQERIFKSAQRFLFWLDDSDSLAQIMPYMGLDPRHSVLLDDQTITKILWVLNIVKIVLQVIESHKKAIEKL